MIIQQNNRPPPGINNYAKKQNLFTIKLNFKYE
jgi:hypothetical protein